MTGYLIKKAAALAAVLFLVSLTVFTVLFVLPGDPAQIILGMNASPETLAALRSRLGLDQPFLVQYVSWIGSLLKGTGGHSITYDIPVANLIGSRLAVTGPLALMAMAIAVVLSLPLGIFAARHQNRPGDAAVMVGTQLGLAVPEFWLGILLMLLFSVHWGVFSAGGFPGWTVDAWGSIKALFLPALALGLIRAAILTRLTRSAMLEVLREDYVRTARAKGLKERTVVYGHALKNAMIPVMTIFGLQMGQLLAGAIIIENVFTLPGLGRLVFQAIGQRDLPVVREVVLFMAAAVVIVNFLVDLSYAVVIRESGSIGDGHGTLFQEPELLAGRCPVCRGGGHGAGQPVLDALQPHRHGCPTPHGGPFSEPSLGNGPVWPRPALPCYGRGGEFHRRRADDRRHRHGGGRRIGVDQCLGRSIGR
jgi:peptide/nickel transport system permease protein